MSHRLRIAMLAHSTNPRGGVVHAMQLSEALTALGHEVVLHAPDAKGSGFFRRPACQACAFPVAPSPLGMTEMVEQRIADYVRHFEVAANRDFDLFHAHDGISGNALATLKECGLAPGFARTVHHVDQFSDPRLTTLQDRSIDNADVFFTVSGLWQNLLRETRQIASTVVGNGVDTQRFKPGNRDKTQDLRNRLKIPSGPVFLCVGGIEMRKNTLHVLEAFRQLRAIHPDAQLVIAGGTSLLDHSGYQGEFRSALSKAGDHQAAVHLIGTVDDADMPVLFTLADTLVFASVKEGFGLVVLEAMASGTPVVVSSIAPFTEYLKPDDAIWCDPRHPASIAAAMAVSLIRPVRSRRVARGKRVAARHSWEAAALLHLPAYEQLHAMTARKEHAHA